MPEMVYLFYYFYAHLYSLVKSESNHSRSHKSNSFTNIPLVQYLKELLAEDFVTFQSDEIFFYTIILPQVYTGGTLHFRRSLVIL